MLSRLALVLIFAFWVTMNVLLWRVEFGGRESGSPVAAEVVWRKMLTAPDSSSLEVFHKKQRIGFCHWAPNVSEGPTAALLPGEEVPPEGMVTRLAGYRIDADGNIAPGELARRLRFNLNLSFNAHRDWEKFHMRLILRPLVWEVDAVAGEEVLRFKMEDQDRTFERVFKFSDLKDPQTLLEGIGGQLPLLLPLPGVAGLPGGGSPGVSSLSLGLNWEAYHDTLRIGHSSVRVYRLQTRLLDRYPVVLTLSRVGEILRVELPDGLVLVNDQLSW